MPELKWRQEAVDIGTLILAVILGLAPWVLDFSMERMAAPNAWICGVAIAALALGALARFAEWEEWANFVLGVWVAASPWILGFAGHEAAMWVHVIIGLMVAALAGVTLWHTHQTPPPATAGH